MRFFVFVFGIFLAWYVHADVVVSNIEARQRYPWNGLVDIAVTICGTAEDVVEFDCVFAASNSATKTAIPIEHITRNGADVGFGNVWTRKFIWDAKASIGAARIDDIVLMVDLVGGVQLWKNGPYWAECNVGAATPEECGYYFWWGDTVGYKRNAGNNGWISVKDSASFLFNEDNCPTYNRPNHALQFEGYIDATGKIVVEYGNLVAKYDAATAHLGAPWRMPTEAEFSALNNNCTTKWTTRNGVPGRLVTGKGAYSAKCIFFPAAGSGGGSNLYNIGSNGAYWSSTPHSSYSLCAWALCFGSIGFDRYDTSYRNKGFSVRPVRGFANGGVPGRTAEGSAVSTILALDCREGCRGISADGEELRYDASWYEDGSCVCITDNGELIETGSVGMKHWMQADSACHHLQITVVDGSGMQVGNEDAYFVFPMPDGDIVIPDCWSELPANLFKDCVWLKAVTIPSSVTSIGKSAFEGCGGLTTVICSYGDVDRIKSLLCGSGVEIEKLDFKERLPMPIFIPQSGTVGESLKISITCAVENATIHYTVDGTEPTVDSPVFKKFMLSEKAELKAIAEYGGCVSEVATAIYAKGRCASPVISSSDQEFHFSGKDVIITCANEGAEIRYTTNGSDPTAQSRLYEEPFTIDDTTTVRAIAVGHPDYFDSEIATATFTREWLTVANPTCNPPDGTTFYLSNQKVALSCEEGASIFYTLNGDLPTRESLRYEEPLSINDTTTIRMVAVRDDYRDSEVVTVKLTRDYYKVAAPTLNVNGSVSFTGSKFIIIVSRDMTSGAVLRYTLDGSDPTEGSPILVGDSIVVTDTTTVKVRAFIEDWKPSDVRAVEVTKVRTLGDALNQPDVAFETSAAYPWVADRNVTHDGEESARSGATPHNGCSWLQTTVDQAAQVKFLWKVSSEKDWDGLSFLTNGIPVAKIDGEVDWTNLAIYVPAGTVLRWEYKKDETTSEGSDCGWVDEITLSKGMPVIEGDEGATVTGDAETGFVIKPSEGRTAVEVTIPQGVDAAKVTVEVSPKVASVKPNGAKVKVVSGDADITEWLDVPGTTRGDDGGIVATQPDGMVDLAKATVKEEIVKEAMDPAKGAEIKLNAANPTLITPNTRIGLFYTFSEGRTLGGMERSASKTGDGKPWSPEIKVKGGNSAFYSIGVGKGE